MRECLSSLGLCDIPVAQKDPVECQCQFSPLSPVSVTSSIGAQLPCRNLPIHTQLSEFKCVSSKPFGDTGTSGWNSLSRLSYGSNHGGD
ncbi:hypothetical protein NHX12_010818 [Muraenolepis orangiensis]|uniref:Uncharacterized protein n=1 Tax=Muraenolepis orangiensis TaxID=630683 RepID=A0A9Q0DEN6_9TELE|nr:hypothetical protein NHX12_010818 [Muraenolepis orangiensis]